MKTIFASSLLIILSHCQLSAQNKALPVANRYLPFSTQAQGIKHEGLKWGLDTAWDDEANIRRGIAYMGKENVEVMRVSFQPTEPLVGDSALTSKQLSALNSRVNHVKWAGNPDLIINSDHPSVHKYYTEGQTANAEHWAKLIMTTTRLYQSKGFNVVTISPFNEPDMGERQLNEQGWSQGNKNSFREVCKYLKENYAEELANIRISGGNTLNDDVASEWYNYLKPYVDEGNTHQLAGSFDNYANFFKEVTNDGNHATADEMHNVGDALVGLEYGMKTGVWWAFDGRARGQLCRATHGDRLAYAENRDAWTSAAVYRNLQDNVIECFVGGSERQAKNSSYSFICTDRDVYFDGVGPTREYYVAYPGGKGYQNGQTNAERVIDISYGQDVQPDTINGTYQLMCRSSRTVLSVNNTAATNGTGICLKSPTSNNYDDWIITPVSSRIGGDWGYFTIKNAKSNFPIDGWNWSLSSGSELNLFDGSLGANEQWYLKYAGEGYYYIINRHSNLYLTASAISSGSAVNQSSLGATENKRKLQQWKIIPTDAKCETTAPVAPAGLIATPQPASIKLSWTPNKETDLVGYMILRADTITGEWNTIARKVQDSTFIDNNCVQGHTYRYAIKAIDYSDNISAMSESIIAQTSNQPTLIARWMMEGTTDDYTSNGFNLKIGGNEKYITLATNVKQGKKSLNLDGTTFAQLPYQIANMPEMTITMWVRWGGGLLGNNQRIFDFANSSNQYMYLTPSNGSRMRFAICNGEEEQYLDAPKLSSTSFRHVALTIGKDSVCLYVNGELVASTADITLRPSDIAPVMNFFGRGFATSAPTFKGYLDDVRIYNYALPASAIALIAGDNIDDVNADGSIDTQDVLSIYNYIQTASAPTDITPEDVNNDSNVDTQDVLKVYDRIQKQ